MEIRNKLIDQMPDNVIPMDFHLYEIKIGEDLMEDVYKRQVHLAAMTLIADSIPLMRFRTRRREVRFWIWIF